MPNCHNVTKPLLVAVMKRYIPNAVVNNLFVERKIMLNIMNALIVKKNVKWNGWKMNFLIIATNVPLIVEVGKGSEI
jgi:hypothetical protein